MLFSNFGHYSLIFGLIISVILILHSIKSLNDNNIILGKQIFYLLFSQFFTVVLSLIFLIYSFVISDFSNQTVYNNSHSTKPLFYKISGTWGNHEGSLLLWMFVLTLFIFIFFIKSKNQPKNYRLLTITFQQIMV